MRTQTEMDDLAVVDEVAPPGVAGRKEFTQAVATPRASAENDAAYDGTLAEEHELDAWARHAFASNGFGDAATGSGSPSYDISREARARRAEVLGDMMVAAIKAVSEFARQAYARYQQHRKASDIYDALRQLDDSTLRDLGFDRSELRSIAVEAAAQADDTSPKLPAERLRT